MLLKYFKRHLVRIVMGLGVMVLFLLDVVGVVPWNVIDRVENFAYDARVVFSMENTVDDRIVIVDIDEKSLAEVGRWPWGRNRLARMLDQLFDKYQVQVVGFDVVFAEPDVSSGLKVLENLAAGPLSDADRFLQQLSEIRHDLDYDRVFADSMKDRQVILGYYFNKSLQEGKVLISGALPEPLFPRSVILDKQADIPSAVGYGANLALLQEAAAGGGHFNPEVDADGVVRRVPMLFEKDDWLYGSLSMSMAQAIMGGAAVAPLYEFALGDRESTSNPKLEWLGIGDRAIPVDEAGLTLVPYRGHQGSFPYVSAVDVIEGRVDPAILQGRAVLVGTTAPGLLDLRSTPVQSEYAGVEIHANLISGILDGNIKEKPGYVVGAEFLILLVTGLIMALLLPALTPLWATVVTSGLLLVSMGLNFYIWQHGNLVMPIASGLIMISLMFLLNMSYGFFVETRGKRQLAGIFGQYVPPELVDEMAIDPSAYSLAGESREMTVLFSDVRGFTTISEGLDPEELSELMNSFLSPMTRTIHEYRGTIDKYMGDAIMAFWGAPLEDPEHPRHALLAGIELNESLIPMNKEFKERGWPEIKIGVGINTGVMNVGNMGSEFRMAYTVMGDAVNLGSRLEMLTKQYGVGLIVSETTAAAVPEFAYRELDRVRVKGKNEPVIIYEPIGLKDDLDKATKDELKLFRETMKLYRAQDWDKAEMQFINLKQLSPDRMLYDLYIERISHFREAPPGDDWDGVFTHTSK